MPNMPTNLPTYIYSVLKNFCQHTFMYWCKHFSWYNAKHTENWEFNNFWGKFLVPILLDPCNSSNKYIPLEAPSCSSSM